MGWVEDLAGSVVGVDTAPFIYYIEANPIYLPRIDPFFAALDPGIQTIKVIVLDALPPP